MQKLKILLVASEIAPFAKTGGLADVSAAIPRFLQRAGHDVRVLMPLYRSVATGGWDLVEHDRLRGMTLEFGKRSLEFSVRTARLPQSTLDVMFLDCPELYGRDEIYSSDPDEHLRFGLLSRACFAVCQWLGWAPDVVHCNDWHTGLAPIYLKAAYAWDELFADTKSVLTIHNIAYQGVFDVSATEDLGFGDDKELLHQEDLQGGVVNFLKTGILYADALTTVSQTYASEIQTEEHGMGLERLLRARSESLVGIVNGVDYGEWNPATDALLKHVYTADSLIGKEENKRALLNEFSLSFDPDAPVFGVVSRMTAQKGFDLLPDILPVLLREQDMRLVVIGSGEERYERYFQWLRDTFPEKVAVYRGYSERLAHWIEAGSDVFLMPSRYEPCGLNQMYSLKYGTVPIVRRTGGLADTVEDYDPITGEGTGFVFDEFAPEALLHAIRRALHAYSDRFTWQRLMANGMSRDYSWDRQGQLYVELYRTVMSR